MIRLVTLRNFPLVDLQIERAYQRRCSDEGGFSGPYVDDDLWWIMREARLRARRNREWLRELEQEVDSLSLKARKRSAVGRRRRTTVVTISANSADRSQRSRKAG